MAIRKLELGKEFKTGWNPDKYIIFVNNRLLPKTNYKILIPSDTNTLKKKVVYFYNSIPNGTSIDIYYIESDEDFNTLPINRDVYIKSKEVFADFDLQKPVKIPYPYASYPRDEHNFMVFTEEGQLLNQQLDYKTSIDRQFITLTDKFRLKEKSINYLVFTFPYCKQVYDLEAEDERKSAGKNSGVSFFYSKSINNQDITTGIVNFTPQFTKYDIDDSNFILYGNSTWIDPYRYEVINNHQIKFKDPTDIIHNGYADYTMIVFSENKTLYTSTKKFHFVPYRVTATIDNQLEFTIPKSIRQENFILFRNSVLMDMKYRYYWVNDTTIRFSNPNDGVKLGSDVVFLFYNPIDSSNNAKYLKFMKIEFETTDDGYFALVPPAQNKNLTFDKDEIMLFLNGTYLSPERYNLVNNKVTFVEKTDKLLANKAITGIYLNAAYKPIEPDPAHEYLDVLESNDIIWFDESHAEAYEY